jgi:hypothetical protein
VHFNGDPRLLTEEVTKRGEVFRGRRVGRGSYLPLFLLLITISQGFRLGGSFLSPHPCSRPGSIPKLAPLLSCLLPFVVDTVGLPPHHILRQGDRPQSTVRIPKTLHKNAYALKNLKFTQSDGNELEQTHPEADDPFP